MEAPGGPGDPAVQVCKGETSVSAQVASRMGNFIVYVALQLHRVRKISYNLLVEDACPS